MKKIRGLKRGDTLIFANQANRVTTVVTSDVIYGSCEEVFSEISFDKFMPETKTQQDAVKVYQKMKWFTDIVKQGKQLMALLSELPLMIKRQTKK